MVNGRWRCRVAFPLQGLSDVDLHGVVVATLEPCHIAAVDVDAVSVGAGTLTLQKLNLKYYVFFRIRNSLYLVY